MSVIDEIRAVQSPGSPAATCGVALIRPRMSPEDNAGMDQALADETIYATSIEKWLKGKSIVCTADTLRRHRKGACQCPR